MTDDEVEKRFLAIAVKLAKPYLNGEYGELPAAVRGDIQAILWEYGYLPALPLLVAEGATAEQTARARRATKTLFEIIEAEDLVPIPPDLVAHIARDLPIFLDEESETALRRLDEKHVDWITEARVEMYFDEPKHRGRPHVAIVLPDGKISVSLEDPPVILTPHGYRGESAARKVVAKYRVRLKALWDQSRPTTQQLNAAARKAPSGKTRKRPGSR